MIRTEHIEYILFDIIGIEKSVVEHITINETDIEIRFQNSVYKESVFDFKNPELTNFDLEQLDRVYKELMFANKNDVELMNVYKSISCDSISLLKIVHFFINEFYFFSPPKLDNHKRITSESIYGNLKKYFNFPIVDVLIDNFTYHQFGFAKQNRTLYLTSDFDYINLWRYLGPIKTMWRLAKHILFLRREMLIEEFWSIWLSNKILGRNFILRNAMFLFNKKIGETIDVKNIAFLLVHHSHKKYDYRNNYNCTAFQQFLLSNIGHVSFGLHPSYNTRFNHDSLSEQIDNFDRIVMERPRYARYHYLNCAYPDDMIPLETHKITHDFSFYFCDSLLFRACTTRPFKQWSKEFDRKIQVTITPLSIMDVTLSKTMKLKYSEAETLAKEKIRLCFLLGNSCVLLWHNNEMYEQLYRKNYSPRLLRALKKHIEELELIR